MKILQFAALVIAVSVHPSLFADDAVPADGSPPVNRLARENSPYLLLHAHNPVDWYPWGEEALERAKAEDKPIFLSVGYSTCYWCHVMEREVFSNPEIAAWMNEHFINIKVDREERPDIDDIYMTALLVYQQLAGSGSGGGWPLSIFLTPEGDPIAGATYLPPEDQPDGRTGFLTAARRIHDGWTAQRGEVERTARMVSAEVRRLSRPASADDESTLGPAVIARAVDSVRLLYDPEWGGVDLSQANQKGPRFPQLTRLLLLMDVLESGEFIPGDNPAATREQLLQIVRHSFTQMARGGIRDHLAGGFHRYSTDRRWRVPHFEKMLYDQALFLEAYTRAAQLTNVPLLHEVAGEIADFVLAEFTTPEGAFCTALDAETDAVEGQYYVWTESEINELLSPEDAVIFRTAYGMTEPASFGYGHVLYLPRSVAAAARRLNLTASELDTRLREMRQTLLDTRRKRERPLMDDKVLTAWNALMIRALAISGQQLQRPADVAAAEGAARFLLDNLRTPDGRLLRTWRDGKAAHPAYLDDYAFLVSALLALHDATGNPEWIQQAQQLNQQQVDHFYDRELHAWCFTGNDHERLIARTSSPFDDGFPSGNSVAVRNLIRLSREADVSANLVEPTLLSFLPAMKKSPASCSGMVMALHDWLRLAGDKADAGIHNSRDWIPASLAAAPAGDDPAGDERDAGSGEDAATGSDEDVVTHSTFRPVLDPEAKSPDGTAEQEKLLKVRIYPMYDKLPRGEKCMVAIELTIRDGWHLQANPPHPEYAIPTEIALKTDQRVRLTAVKFPQHRLHRMKGEDEPYHVYDGKVLVYGLLEIDPAERSDRATLEFHVRYQACNDDVCRPPDRIVMKGQLPLANPTDDIRKINEDKFPKPGKKP